MEINTSKLKTKLKMTNKLLINFRDIISSLSLLLFWQSLTWNQTKTSIDKTKPIKANFCINHKVNKQTI